MAAPKAANQKAAPAPAEKKPAKKKGAEKKEDEDFNYIVRMANTDIDGQKNVVIGLQSIKGVGSRVAEIVVKKSGVDTTAKIGALSDADVKNLEESIVKYVEFAPEWAINRQNDYETGADMHLLGNDLNIILEDDINRMRMMRSYRGVRHETHHKVRGQKTKSNGRKGLQLGVTKK